MEKSADQKQYKLADNDIIDAYITSIEKFSKFSREGAETSLEKINRFGLQMFLCGLALGENANK